MNPMLILSLRSLALLFSLQGEEKTAASFTLLADSAEMGKNIDAHMKNVADQLSAGRTIDYLDLRARILSDSERINPR